MMDVRLYFYLLAWSLLNIGDVKRTKGPTCLLPEDDISRKYMCHKVTCRKEYVVAIFETAAGLKPAIESLQEHGPVCIGETGVFIYDSLRCFWKRNCTLMFPLGRMITSNGGDLRAFTNGYGQRAQPSYKCYDKEPDFACIINTMCIKKKEIYDAASLKRCQHPSKIKRRKGIIRSHDHYPWNYEQTKPPKIIRLKRKIGTSKILHVGVYDLDIRDDDNITMTTAIRTATLNSSGFTMNGRQVGDLTSVLTFNHTDQYVQFSLSAKSFVHSRGFVICFKESKIADRRHPCKRVFKKANISTIDPNSKTCLKNSNGTKAKEKCCCDANNHDLCDDAIKLAIELAKHRQIIDHP